MPSDAPDQIMELPAEHGFDGLTQALTGLLNAVMTLERARALGAAPCEPSERRQGYANGVKPKAIPSRIGPITVAVPQARGIARSPSALEKRVRSERASKPAGAAMDVRGVSTRKGAAITGPLRGLEVTSGQVSRAAAALDAELEAGRGRPPGARPSPILDARSETVRHGGSVVSRAVLVAIGIDAEGRRSTRGTSVSLSEAEAHRRDFLAAPPARGPHGIRRIGSDGHAGLTEALNARSSGVARQRCQSHLARNAAAYVPKAAMRAQVGASPRAIFDAPDRPEAERQWDLAVQKYRTTAPKLAGRPEANVPEGRTAFASPPSHRRRSRTTNLLEPINGEIKRRTRVATRLPNEASALRLVGAVLMEISEEWETNRKYVTMESE